MNNKILSKDNWSVLPEKIYKKAIDEHQKNSHINVIHDLEYGWCIVLENKILFAENLYNS